MRYDQSGNLAAEGATARGSLCGLHVRRQLLLGSCCLRWAQPNTGYDVDHCLLWCAVISAVLECSCHDQHGHLAAEGATISGILCWLHARLQLRLGSCCLRWAQLNTGYMMLTTVLCGVQLSQRFWNAHAMINMAVWLRKEQPSLAASIGSRLGVKGVKAAANRIAEVRVVIGSPRAELEGKPLPSLLLVRIR